MASWTPTRSVLLSQLLDDVVGTEEMVKIRQDYCRIWDCINSTGTNITTYYTGSRTEGLDLPGSDKDCMLDINNKNDMHVIQSQPDAHATMHTNLFLMSTDNVRPCFVMLRSVSPIRDKDLFNACQEMNNSLYLSSYLYVHNTQAKFTEDSPHIATTKQGPSIEVWSPYMDRSESGVDKVFQFTVHFGLTQQGNGKHAKGNTRGPFHAIYEQ